MEEYRKWLHCCMEKTLVPTAMPSSPPPPPCLSYRKVWN